jgi:hypothetical protein
VNYEFVLYGRSKKYRIVVLISKGDLGIVSRPIVKCILEKHEGVDWIKLAQEL